jgi:hypothetical protein
MSGAASPPTALSSLNSSVTVVSIDRAGRALGPARATGWPLQPRGLTAISIRFQKSILQSPQPDLFRLRGPHGEIIAEVRPSD